VKPHREPPEPDLPEWADEDDEQAQVEARTYWESVWLRLKRDKLALAGAGFIVFLFIVAFAGAPLAAHILGHGPNEPFLVSGGLDADQLPAGPWTHVGKLTESGELERQLLVLGSDSTLARDEFLRLLYGAQVSLEVGVGATLLSLFLGTIAGAVAGFFGGWADTTISRMVDLTMAFPYLLFVITLVLVFGLLGWFYSARVMRSVALSLREKEFIEAARMTGASDFRIIRSHIFPHLVGPLIVLATLNVAAFILAEAGLSFLGLGIQLPTASWGNLLADAPQYYTSRPLLMLWPGIALVLTTLAFNLLGDGLRDAFDPRSGR
jgi:peptide/nickel transport system permease protein